MAADEEQTQPAASTSAFDGPGASVTVASASVAEDESTTPIPIPIAECPIPNVPLPDIGEAPTGGVRSGDDRDPQSDPAGDRAIAGIPSIPQSTVAEMPQPPPSEPAPVEDQPATPVEARPAPESTDSDTPPPVAPAAALWQYRPVPPEEAMPDPYPEYACRLIPGAHGVRLVAARARGKKHKHEGTNCDDWFEIATCGAWNLIAVADGAGSKRFSRVGAKTACEVAVTSLRTALGEVRLAPRRWTDTATVFARDEQDEFVQTDLRLVGNTVRQAVVKAVQAVQQAAAVRRGSERHQHVLGGRDIEVNDLAATLLIVAQTVVEDETGQRYDLAMSVAIGDGIIGALSWEGHVHLMMEADQGQFSGETEFLSARTAEPARLDRRLRLFIGRPRRAFLVMTDGVADDYFPNDPGLARLFGDLALNGLVALPPNLGSDAGSAPVTADPPPVETLTVAGERLTAEGRQPLALYSVARYVEHLGVPVDQVIADSALLRAGCRPDPLPGDDAAERLLAWLDGYQVRGSFDDRTLVIADREGPL